jgi:hypothetical protein
MKLIEDTECGECKSVCLVAEVGEPQNCDDSLTAYVCESCLRKTLALFVGPTEAERSA